MRRHEPPPRDPAPQYSTPRPKKCDHCHAPSRVNPARTFAVIAGTEAVMRVDCAANSGLERRGLDFARATRWAHLHSHRRPDENKRPSIVRSSIPIACFYFQYCEVSPYVLIMFTHRNDELKAQVSRRGCEFDDIIEVRMNSRMIRI